MFRAALMADLVRPRPWLQQQLQHKLRRVGLGGGGRYVRRGGKTLLMIDRLTAT